MLRIYVGDNEVIIAGKKKSEKVIRRFKKSRVPLQVFQLKKGDDVKSVIEQAEHTYGAQGFLITGMKSKKLATKYLSYYRILEAAGGVVLSEDQKVLMMFRRGKWDLPKGKIDPGETDREAAEREVKEETGIIEVKVGRRILFHEGHQDCTYHTYWLGGVRTIKKTHWFKMKSSDRHELTPQADEGITEVGWYSKKQVKSKLNNSYRSVRWVLEEYFGKDF
ncbi:MAG: NUDIX domain-containing protein [Chitinophagales bacterium]|nr:NUDIX domain-containing protein [Chitinophagales bacterium]